MVVGVPAIVYGLAEIGETNSFTSIKVIGPIIVGSVLVALFVLHALHARRPLLNVRLYKKPTFSTASIAMFFVAAALFGGMILLPLYWQSVRHESVIVTGLLTAPQGIGAAMMMPVAGRLTDRIGGGPLTLFGVVLTAVATIPFALIGPHTSIVFLCAVMVIRGFGIGFAFMPAMSAAFASLSRDQLSDATPQLNVLQRVGGAIGIAVLTVVLQRSLESAHTLSQAGQQLRHGVLVGGRVDGAGDSAVDPADARRATGSAAGGGARRARRSAGGGDGGMSATTAAPDRRAATALADSFKTLMGAVRRLRGRETHSHDGLSNAQFQLLFGLREGKLLSGSELACVAGLSPATTTQMLDGLEAAGLVVRERSLQDRRRVMTSLTERGHALVEQRHARFAPMWRQALAGFSDDELATAGAVMDKLGELFDQLATADPD